LSAVRGWPAANWRPGGPVPGSGGYVSFQDGRAAEPRGLPPAGGRLARMPHSVSLNSGWKIGAPYSVDTSRNSDSAAVIVITTTARTGAHPRRDGTAVSMRRHTSPPVTATARNQQDDQHRDCHRQGASRRPPARMGPERWEARLFRARVDPSWLPGRGVVDRYHGGSPWFSPRVW
jgi:hypothetical protein